MEAWRNATRLAHYIMKDHVKEGDSVIDATCGTGQDTLFLAGLTGRSGRVLAFDIQEQAIETTRKLLQAHACEEQVSLIKDNHKNLQAYIQTGVNACMFNLGYLPGGDHTVKTNPFDTVQAVSSALKVLDNGGILTIVSYPGHPGGLEEQEALHQSLSLLPQKEYEVLASRFINQVNHPPQLLVVKKLI